LKKLWTNDARAYEEKNMDLLENFYAPIFESGKVKPHILFMMEKFIWSNMGT